MRDANPEIEHLFASWLNRTVELHIKELGRQGIKGTRELEKSISGEYKRLGKGYLEGSLYFADHGRMVDMGSGRGWSHGKRIQENSNPKRGNGKARKKKPWYGRVWYARINDLQGAVGLRVMERVKELQAKTLQ